MTTTIQETIEALPRYTPESNHCEQWPDGKYLWRDDVLVALQAAPTQGSIDTAEFRSLLFRTRVTVHDEEAIANLVAHIDAHIAQRAASGDAPASRVWDEFGRTNAGDQTGGTVQRFGFDLSGKRPDIIPATNGAYVYYSDYLELFKHIAQRAANVLTCAECNDAGGKEVGSGLLGPDWEECKACLGRAAPAPIADGVAGEFNSEVLGRVTTYLSQFPEFQPVGDSSADQTFRNIVDCIELLRNAPKASAPATDHLNDAINMVSAPAGDLPPLPEQPQQLTAYWECEDCAGHGVVGELQSMGHFQPPEAATCSACDGKGRTKTEAFLPEQMHAYVLADRAARAAAAPAGHAEPMAKPVHDENARYAIDSAISFGVHGINKPPSDDHWLMSYWVIGNRMAAYERAEKVAAPVAAEKDITK